MHLGMRTSTPKTIDLNSLLIFANLAIAALLVWAYSRTAGNPYIDQETVVLGLVLCAQTYVALMLERLRRDPLVLLLALEMIAYFSLRILTLAIYPISEVFDRYPYGVSDSNFALIFIIIANFFLYAGLFAARSSGAQPIDATNWGPSAPSRVAFLVALAIGVSYFTAGFRAGESLPRVIDFLQLFVSANVIILMSLAYYFLFHKSLSRGFAALLGILILVDLVVHTLSGSRSAIVAIIQDFILVGLAISGCIRLRRTHVTVGLILLPVVVMLLVGSFLVATFNRANREIIGASFDFGRAMQTAQLASEDMPIAESLDRTVPHVLARVGFFDYSAEIIAHRAQYGSLINFSVYGESIVDNILTPGFDVYDMPKIANGLQFIYLEMGTPSKVDVPEMYQSDQLGVYGELYALFGYACLPLMFLIAYLFKQLYSRVRSTKPFMLVVKRVVVLYLFVAVIQSFGMDWVLAESVPILAAIYLYEFFFPSKRVSVALAAG